MENIQLEANGLNPNQRVYREIVNSKMPIILEVLGTQKDIEVGQTYDEEIPKRKNLDSFIYGSLTRLVPNIKESLYSPLYSIEEIKSWIELSRRYGKEVLQQFEEKCNAQLAIVKRFEDDLERRNTFDLTKINDLPIELINEIYRFIPYEEQLVFLTEKYPEEKRKEMLLSTRTLDELKAVYTSMFDNYMDFYKWKDVPELDRNKIYGYEIYSYIGLTYEMQRKRGVYRKTDVPAYINFRIKKLINLKKPKNKKEELIYNAVLKKTYEFFRSIIYIITKIPKKSRSKARRTSTSKT